MVNGIRIDNLNGFKKARRSKIRVGSRVRQTPEEGSRIYRLKRYGNNDKDKDNSPKTLNDAKLYSLMTFSDCIFQFSDWF